MDEFPSVVRVAVPDDRDGIKSLCHLLHEENGLFPLNETRLEQMLDRFYNRGGAMIGVIGPVGSPVGCIYLSIEQAVYTNAWQLTEQFAFTHPDHRRSHHAQTLIEYAKKLSLHFDLPLLVGILSNHRVEAKARLYDRQLERAGYFYVFNREAAGRSARDG